MLESEKEFIIEDFNTLMEYFKKTKGITLAEHAKNIESYFNRIYHNVSIKIQDNKLMVNDEILAEYKEEI